ncbi:MAG: Hpt domain-containing protein [Crocinitomicaceae bacterium]|nr:Hpt domain-containing protein [Crocinitomicaceae bacterium]
MMQENSRFDIEALNELREGGEEYYFEMLETLTLSLSEGLEEMREAFQQKNWQRIGDRAHGMRGPCGHLGIDSLWHLLNKLEEKSNENPDPDEVEKLLKKTEDEASLVIQELVEMSSKKEFPNIDSEPGNT